MNTHSDILIGDIFPNPLLPDGKAYIALAGDIKKPVAVFIRTPEGKLCFQAVHCLPKTGGTIAMDLKALEQGRYEISLNIGRYQERKSLTVGSVPRSSQWKKISNWIKQLTL